ncbi:DUF6087 family protein [Streptomyces goshikiensis]
MDEPLDRWAARRAKRLRPVGERKAVTLAPGAHGSHVHPNAPRLILEWDGYQWTTLATVPDRAAARRFLNPRRPTKRCQRLPPGPPWPRERESIANPAPTECGAPNPSVPPPPPMTRKRPRRPQPRSRRGAPLPCPEQPLNPSPLGRT